MTAAGVTIAPGAFGSKGRAVVDDYELDDDEIRACALETVLARLRANDEAVEAAWLQVVRDRRALRALEIDLTDL